MAYGMARCDSGGYCPQWRGEYGDAERFVRMPHARYAGDALQARHRGGARAPARGGALAHGRQLLPGGRLQGRLGVRYGTFGGRPGGVRGYDTLHDGEDHDVQRGFPPLDSHCA